MRRWVVLGLLIAVVAAGAAIWGPEVDTGEDPPPVPLVLGGHLSAPVDLQVPPGAVVTADAGYVGLLFPAGGVALVTVPTEVVEPSGAHVPLPTDPAAWLARHPAVFISRVRAVTVGGVSAVQLDYRRSRTAGQVSRFARLPLFCGWQSEKPDRSTASVIPVPSGTQGTVVPVTSQGCTQITAGARVRATFVPVDGRIVLVEAVWRTDWPGVVNGRMPRELQRSYAALLDGLAPKAAGSSIAPKAAGSSIAPKAAGTRS